MAIVRIIAGDSAKVGFSKHARERLSLRGISNIEAIRVLRLGDIKGKVTPGNQSGEWRCKVTAPLRGSREIGVVTIVCHESTLFVKTVEWED